MINLVSLFCFVLRCLLEVFFFGILPYVIVRYLYVPLNILPNLTVCNCMLFVRPFNILPNPLDKERARRMDLDRILSLGMQTCRTVEGISVE